MRGLHAQVRFERGNFKLEASIALAPGKITALLGPSGSGKSTLLRILAGLERPRFGTITVSGERWVDSGSRTCLSPQRRRAGVVFQDYALFEHLTVEENIVFGAYGPERLAVAHGWLRRFHLQEYARVYPGDLSGGQRQRVALARALMIEPRLLLLDEPLSALDTRIRSHLRQELREVVRECDIPALLVTHDLDEARELGEQIYVMLGGRILRHGDQAAVFSDPHSREVAEVLGWKNFLSPRGEIIRWLAGGGLWPQGEGWVGIHPHHLSLGEARGAGLPVQVQGVVDYGAYYEVVCGCGDEMLYVHCHYTQARPVVGQRRRLRVDPAHLTYLAQSRITQ